jgi:hypothetical protein
MGLVDDLLVELAVRLRDVALRGVEELALLRPGFVIDLHEGTLGDHTGAPRRTW